MLSPPYEQDGQNIKLLQVRYMLFLHIYHSSYLLACCISDFATRRSNTAWNTCTWDYFPGYPCLACSINKNVIFYQEYNEAWEINATCSPVSFLGRRRLWQASSLPGVVKWGLTSLNMAFGVVLYVERLVFYWRRASGPLMRELLAKEANMIPV